MHWSKLKVDMNSSEHNHIAFVYKNHEEIVIGSKRSHNNDRKEAKRGILIMRRNDV